MNTPTRPKFGPADEALATMPTVYRDGLFDGKVVLVSGAGSGIGKAIAFLFARLGATLAICGRKPEKLEDCAEKLRALSGKPVSVHPMTIRDPLMVDAMLTEVWQAHGGLDVLVNNAGGQFAANAFDISPKGWHAVIDTNLNGTWYMMQGAARRWVAEGRRGGNIITITAAVERSLTQMTHTTASRGAVNMLSRTLALEWAEHGIRVNCVAPGTIESTGFHNYNESHVEHFALANAMQKTGDVQDTAEAVVYLAGPSGKYLTGVTLPVEGGLLLWGEFWPAGRPAWFAPRGPA
ncbi:MAG: SDR family oxidoreductase [Burkholderiales bacterium]|nr:SDR family oxidoreductase [Burkholderiales bacterium]